MQETIFALSSGLPPAAIAVIRISGPRAGDALHQLAGREIAPRRASLVKLRSTKGEPLDSALAIWFPGPQSATGEDLAELHCHGGRAVVRAVSGALDAIEGLREAEPGEFTRRSFANGRIDLAEAEGLADLLAAETEMQRSFALAMAGGAFSRQAEAWRGDLLKLSARVETSLDFSDEEDALHLDDGFKTSLAGFAAELRNWLARPPAERLSEGFRIVLAGPPNSGKSTLFNVLVQSEAAITSSIAGTTRDVIERSVAIEGIAMTFVDTAGLRDQSEDTIERIGVERAKEQLARADLVLWLGAEGEGPPNSWEVDAKIDEANHKAKRAPRLRLSAVRFEGITQLKQELVEAARQTMPKPGELALNRRQSEQLTVAVRALEEAVSRDDPLLIAESLRSARLSFDRLIGRSATEDMLDALFARFCIGK